MADRQRQPRDARRAGLRFVAAAALGAIALSIAAAGGGLDARAAEAQAAPVMLLDVDIAQGEARHADHCAACHGADFEGQPDWQTPGPGGRLPAPPHDETGHTWHHPDAVLFQYTKLGGREALALHGVEFDSGMPGFAGQLTDREIWNILAFIQSTWPARQQQVQAAPTEAS